MNKVHNVIWSKAKNAWVVVADGTNNCSKSGVRGLKVMIALIMLSPAIGMSATLPQGGVISVGEGTIVNTNSNKVTIKQTTDKLGVNWQSFNVGADGQVVFEQPNSKSVALNRVVGSDGSTILGKIDANGQVLIINPNGVIFGKDAQVNVGGLVASTLNITDADFKNGNYAFNAVGAKNGEVVNLGSLQAAEGGYVALLGKSVKNQGIIKAKLGTAAMAAGNAVTLDFAGDGLVNIQVKESAVNALVENKGLIKADGGNVLMTARASNALLNTVVNNEGVVEAQTIGTRGGKIFLDGGTDSGTVLVAGTLDASAPVNGNGGFIETSGANVKVADGAKVTTLAKKGKTGEWLVDPTDFYVQWGSGAQSSSQIGATTLENNLALTNVTLQTSAAGAEAGDIYVNWDLTWSANTSLTLDAHGDIYLNYNVNVLGDSGGLNLKYGSNGTVAGHSVNLARDKRVNLTGANTTYSENGVSYTVVRSAADLVQFSGATGNAHYVLAGDIDASATAGWNAGAGYKPGGVSTTFTGALQGLNHSIFDLYINRPAQDNVGLFGYSNGASISNISVTGTVIGKSFTGLLIGNAENGKIHNVAASGSVTGANYTGGLAGSLDASTLTYGSADASVIGALGTGGLVGRSFNAAISQSYSKGSVQGSDIWTGGLVGYAYQSTLADVFSTSDVSGVDYSGGLVGVDFRSTISTAYSTGNVTGTVKVGGLTGGSTEGTYSTVFSTSNVTGDSEVGGLIGDAGVADITYAYSTGDVSGTSLTGGFVGTNSGANIRYTYTTSKVGPGSYAHSDGFGASWENYYLNTSDGMAWGSISAITDAQMKSAATFSSWNLSNQGGDGKIWRIYEGKTGPLLRAFMGSVPFASINDTSTGYIGRNLVDGDVSFGISYSNLDGFFKPRPDLFVSLTSNGAAIRNAGTYVLDGLYSSQFGYDITEPVKATLTVTKALLNVNASAQNKTYDGTTNATVTFGDNRKGTDSLTISGAGAFADKNAGSGKAINVSGINVTGADAANYTWTTTAATTASITKATLTVTATGHNKQYDGNANAGITFSGNKFGADVVSIGSGAKTYADKNAGVGKTVTAVGLTLFGADAANYQLASTTVTATANIDKRNLNITATGVDKTYDGTSTVSVNLSDNKVAGDSLSVSSTGATFSNKNAGTNKLITVSGINVTGADAANYTWSLTTTATAAINKAALLVSASGINKIYDGSTAAGITLGDNRFGSDVLVLSAASKSFTDKNAGLGKTVNVSGINVTGGDSGNYTWNTSATTTADITKAALNVTAVGVNKTYDSTTAASANLSDDRIGSDVLVLSSSGKNFADKNAGTGKTITVSGINVTGADAGNYTWNTSAATTADIAKAALNVTATGVNKTYDGTTSAGASLSDDRIGSDNLVLSSTGKNFADKNAATGKTVTVSGIDVTGADAGNYTWNTSTTTTADIAKAALAVTAAGVNKTYDATTVAGANLSDNRIGSDVLVLSAASKTFADKSAGLGKTIAVSGINVTGADAGNYVWNTSTSTTADITKAALTVTAAGVNKTYDSTTAAGATLSDDRIGSDVLVLNSASKSFSDKNAGVGKTISVTGIDVTGADAGNYTWNTTAATTADIAKAALSVTAAGINRTYDGSTAAGATLSDNRIGADVLVLNSASASFADKNAGSGKSVTVNGIDVTGADANNYTWNSTAATSADISKANLTVTAAGINKTYDGSAGAGATLGDNRIGSDVLVLSSTDKSFADKNAGTGKTVTVSGITLTGADAGNYTWNTSASTTADITKAALVVSASGVNKTYDGTTSAGVSFSDDRIGSDDLVINAASKAFTDKNAGTGKAINVGGISVSGTDAGNYTWNAATSTVADISKAALTVTASGISKVYDGSTVAGVNLSDDRIGADLLVLGATSKTFSDKNAGLGKGITVSGINVAGVDAGNYTWNTTATTAADITKAALNVTATGVSKTYDGNTTANVVFSDNRISADSLVIGAGNQAFADKNAGTGKSINVSGITVTGADVANYTWNASTATSADITKAALNVTASGIGKTYDGTTAANVLLNDDRIGADDLTVSAGSKAFSDKNAALGKSITVGGISVTGADSANYTWNTTTTTSADIAKAALNITASGVNKSYDGTTAAAVNLSDDRSGTDVLTVSAGSKAFVDKNAGSGKSVNVGAITVTGADAGNYTWNTSATTTADIAKAALNVTASGISKTYDGSTIAGVNYSDDRLGSDSLAINASSAFADKNAGLGKAITVNGISVTGADAGNYVWNTTAVTSADITKAALNITASGINKTYDGTTSAGAVLHDDRIGSDLLVVNAASKAFSDKNAGLGKTISIGGIQVTGADAGNYTWNATALAFSDIAKASLNITATGVSKTYDGTNFAAVTLGDNRLGADLLVVDAASKAFSDKNAGNGKSIGVNGITVTGVDAGNYTWNASTATTANITKADLVVSATGLSKVYDSTTAASTSLSDNRIGTDDLLINSASSAFADKNAGHGKSILITGINVTGADAGNYNWNSSTTAIADIAKSALNITATGVSKTYDGTTSANVIFGDNRIGSDLLTVNAASNVFVNKNAGAGKTIDIQGITLSGADSVNYTWNTNTSAIANIAKAALNVTAVGVSKSYDGTDSAQVSLNDNRLGSDLLDVTAANTQFIDADVGNGKSIHVNGIAVSGADASNYLWNTSTIATADISATVTPPIVTPPVVTPPVVTPPVVTPPTDSKPPVQHVEETKAINAITSVTSASVASVPAQAKEGSAVMGDFGLINLGMKLPDEVLSDSDHIEDAAKVD